MPARRKSLALLKATGAYAHDPKRYRDRLDTPETNGPVGDPPAYFDQAHRDCWYELVDEAPSLCKADGIHLELTCRLLARWRHTPSEGSPVSHGTRNVLERLGAHLGLDRDEIDEVVEEMEDALTVNVSETRLLARCLSAMGMDPASRMRMSR